MFDLADRIDEETNMFRDDESYLKEIKLLKIARTFWMVIAVMALGSHIFW